MSSKVLLACLAVLAAAQPLAAQGLPRTYTDGKRALISRGPDEVPPVPDVMTLKDGRRLEAYFLATYRHKVVYYLRVDERLWERHVIPNDQVAGIEKRQYLDEDPLAVPTVRRASKQPVPKGEILAGEFVGHQGRHTSWRLTFHSQNNKARAFAEDATEFGDFSAVSRFRQKVVGKALAHEVTARGQYFLYAPGTANNADWLLVLNGITINDTDLAPHRSIGTEIIPQEAFIVDLSPDHGAFRLDWANIGSQTWSALTQVTYRRVRDEPDAPVAPRPEVRRSRSPHVPRRRSAPAVAEADSALAHRFPAKATKNESRWGTGWWGRPRSRLGRPVWKVRGERSDRQTLFPTLARR